MTSRARARIAEAKYDASHRAQRRAAAKALMTKIRAQDPEAYNTKMREYRKSETGKVAVKRHITSDKRHQYVKRRRQRPDVIAAERAYRESHDGRVVAKRAKDKFNATGGGYKWRLKREYGLSWSDYQKLLLEQNNTCAICHKPSSRRLHVDHDHRTGKVRGLLCFKCNSGIGMFGDDSAALTQAIGYLNKHLAVVEDYVI